MPAPNPADELCEIRAVLARLTAREASLCAAFLRDPDQGAVGRFSKIEVVRNCIMEFDITLLPDNLRHNVDYYRERTILTVQSLPMPTAPSPRPGWPIRREVAAMH
ncbi:MAG: hypothetical protein U1A24_15260 [Cypionkella sp.]|uniref:hypothetical protein n=1 Tax=Cypionkella sp. TaxID=2811411 RepID=UPI002ABC8FC1|nr:hypothetical protein [Cypionkella sp.]MDZ4311902.1 hypothetical protein [Cypionkella sp.]MDZ4391468.1 hypothetical protein [Cypionkella sp.]